jgi:hypothetical protein
MLPEIPQQPLEPLEMRMVQERSELSERCTELDQFLFNPVGVVLSEAELARLKAQRMFMEGYMNILSDRIAAVFREKNLGA